MTTQVQSEIIADASITTAKLAAGAVTPAKLSQALTLMTAAATTSGTAIDFTGIPSWVKRVTVMFNGVSTNGSSSLLVQVGSGSVQNTGYVSGSTSVSTSTANSTGGNSSTAGFTINSNNAASVISGAMVITNVSGNTWVATHNTQTTAGQIATCSGAGVVTLSGTLDRVRLTSVTPDTFDAGSVNILYEG